ncbi:MAG: beta-ketoacyl-ACP synthase II [Ignavibacteriales bacterium]|nr:beta-ketoacyl-ACP synthase II [Ignavibacteriales bacterium]
MRRVVVTGIGMVSPLGLTTKESWGNCLQGRSGIDRITRFDPEAYPTRIAGEVKGFDGRKYMDGKDAGRYDIVFHYSWAATQEAVQESKLEITPGNAERVGIIIGSGIGGLKNIFDTSLLISAEGPRRVSPFFVAGSIINTCSGYAAIQLGAKGPNYSVVSACATGNHAIADGFHSIRRDEADVMIVGGSEAPITPLGLAGFSTPRALSRRNDEPTKASRPFDKGRDGFVLGEGAAVLIIEEYEHARRRGAPLIAEILSCGMSADAFHITAPSEKGEGAARAMNLALRWAGIKPEDIDYINAHGTSTPIGDVAETDAIKTTFDSHARKLAVSSTKSMTGHLLGAAAAIEAAFTALALKDQMMPPTINQEFPDPECDLDYVPNTAQKRPIRYALSNGFGFGGTNSSLCLKRID